MDATATQLTHISSIGVMAFHGCMSLGDGHRALYVMHGEQRRALEGHIGSKMACIGNRAPQTMTVSVAPGRKPKCF